ncbi:MAG TPA: hypothetical protein VGA19_08035 [Rhodospirillales bacterium]|jgi:hypothetical protein
MHVKYWIVGGTYTNTDFNELVGGEAEVKGPYLDRDDAVQAWRRLASETRHDCLSRFSIAEEVERR